jgi:3-hydroxyacyl-CoA dehydrogenase
VDRALEDFGFAMGPYAVADLAGLDIGWANRKRLAAVSHAPRTLAAFPDRLCEAGHFGRKTGKGYYVYTGADSAPPLNPDALTLIEQDRARSGVAQRSFTAEDIQRRYMTAMVNEAARVLDEGVARRPLDIDLVMVLGYGFPRYRGGPCHWADRTGLGGLLAETERLAETDARFWHPAPLLRRLADAGLGFADLDRAAVG